MWKFPDESKNSQITMPSNYIPPIESGYVSDSPNQLNELLNTKSKMQETMTHSCDEQANKKTSKSIF